MSRNIRIGTSGWSYDDWVGPFYEPGTKAAGYLSAYAAHFDTVEVDSTYYRPPALRTVEGWAAKTPKNFRFAVKAPGDITHEKVLKDCGRDWDSFVAALQPLGDKLSCVLLQFGYFNKKAFATSKPFLERLEAFFAANKDRVPLAVEIRNKNWLSDDYFGLLKEHRVSTAVAQHVWMPPMTKMLTDYDVRTGPLVYVRLIGDRAAIEEQTTTWDKVVVNRDKELREIAAAIRALGPRVPVVVFANNHYAGHGPATARRFRDLLDEDT